MRHNVFAVLPFPPPCRDHYLYATVFLPAQPTCRHSYVIKHLSVPRYVDIIIRTSHSICQYPDRTLQNAFSLASIVHLFYWVFYFILSFFRFPHAHLLDDNLSKLSLYTSGNIHFSGMTCQFNFQYDSCGSNTTNGMNIGPLLGKDGFIVVYDITNYVSMNNKLTNGFWAGHPESCVMVNMLVSSAIERGCELWSGQTKDICFSTRHAALTI